MATLKPNRTAPQLAKEPKMQTAPVSLRGRKIVRRFDMIASPRNQAIRNRA
jgi:hypothetical protein